MVVSAPELSRFATATGLVLSAGLEGPVYEGRPVQCLRIAAGVAPALERALASPGGGWGRVIARAVEAASGEHLLVLERGRALPATATGAEALAALGAHAAEWQERHPAATLAETEGYRRGVLQQALRTRAEALLPGLDTDSRTVLDAELRHQGLYRFEDLPLAGSYWRSVRDFSVGCGLADLAIPSAPIPAFWQLARMTVELAVGADGTPDVDGYRALLSGYHRRRPLAAIERGAAPTLVRLAAFDDWLSALENAAPGRPERDRLAVLQAVSGRLQAIWVRAAA
jgi:hypothetical protein